MTTNNTERRRQQDYFAGEIKTSIKGLSRQIAELSDKFEIFKSDVYNKITENSTKIARRDGVCSMQRSLLGGLSFVGGFIGGLLKGWLIKQ